MDRNARQARWTNDWLDLLNYASSIGDEAWRESILQELRHGDALRELEEQEERRLQLQLDLEEISRQMEGIYLQLREEESGSIRSSLWNAAWQLKKERARLVSLLRGDSSSRHKGQRLGG
ncbi:hypothetical protein ACTHPH_05695 [Paenibacillus pasadenensis]|uniref:Uncharacterized protein n=1 Tax=Paenibacillus pasadenensis TaxID=217090 RepID=A0A2N5NCZ2_9BACL|nr:MULTISPECIES: hypothetical protein [Paenibacillus]PLT48214.1 hypothetical protein B8V81_0346 [Paenibacillus pasadenensis]QGG58274.1 hypothetical protein GE073_23650 [Paenibacillus sp. B01]